MSTAVTVNVGCAMSVRTWHSERGERHDACSRSLKECLSHFSDFPVNLRSRSKMKRAATSALEASVAPRVECAAPSLHPARRALRPRQRTEARQGKLTRFLQAAKPPDIREGLACRCARPRIAPDAADDLERICDYIAQSRPESARRAGAATSSCSCRLPSRAAARPLSTSERNHSSWSIELASRMDRRYRG